MPAAPPETASRYYAASAVVANRAAAEAVRVRPRGLRFAWEVLARGQIRQAVLADDAVDVMLLEQGIDVAAEALLNSTAFATSLTVFEQMAEGIAADQEAEFARLVASLTQDAGRAAQEVAIAVRPNIGHVRYLSPPSCSRCAVLAGRVYRYSEGFERHTGCDCVMIPTTLANPDFTQDPVDLMERGLVRGLSKADRAAILAGADFNKVVNVRAKAAGLSESGRVLSRNGKMTPEAIFRAAGDDRDALAELLESNGYVDLANRSTPAATGGRGDGGNVPPRVRGMLGPDTPDEFPEFNGYRPGAKRSQIDDFTTEDAASILDGDVTPEESRRIVDRVRRDPDYNPPHGGHRSGTGWGKHEFPSGWTEDDVIDWVRAIIDAPSRAEPGVRDGFSLWGAFRGVFGVVRVQGTGTGVSWYIASAYPQDVSS